MPTTTETPTAPHDFEAIYAEAHGNTSLIPWDDGRPHPALVAWLNRVAPSLIRCGARVAVVGSGLGDDARELVRRGYDVTAFDCSETAIEWARRLEPATASCFHVADLFDLPLRWHRRFDLVVEVNTIQALSPDRRRETVQAITDLLSPHGHLLVVCRGAAGPVSVESGPPWAMTETELLDATAAAGLAPEGSITVFDDDETPPVRRMRALFRRR